MTTRVRPGQINIEGGIPGQLLGIVGGEWAPVDPPTGGGGGGGGGTGAFFDDFERTDRPLDGDNGWAAASAQAALNGDQVATFGIVSGKLTGSDTWGGYPILHDRQSSVAGVADVACEVGFPDSASEGDTMGIVYAATPNCSEGMAFLFDGSVGYWEIDRYADGRYSGSPSVFTDHGWVGWHYTDPMVIRCVYTEATHTLEVYQNGTLALTIDVSDTNGGFYFGHEVAPLSTMTHGGLVAAYSALHNRFNNFSVDGATTPPVAGFAGDPAFDITDTPVATPDPGYAYLTSDGKGRIWTGTGWRQFLTTAYYPPGEDDAIFMLPSLVGRYVAESLPFTDGDPVTAWPDISGLSNDLVVTTAGTMRNVGIGSNKSVEFAKATLYQLPAAVPTPNTVIAVIKNTDGGTGSLLFSDAANHYVGILVGAGMRVSDGSSVYVDHPLSNYTDPHVIYGRVDASGGGGGMDAGADDGRTHSVATIPFSVLRLGNWAAGLGYSMQGLVSEILIYDTVLTDSQLDAIVNQLKLIYGIA